VRDIGTAFLLCCRREVVRSMELPAIPEMLKFKSHGVWISFPKNSHDSPQTSSALHDHEIVSLP
jgi:hypothetical protein